VRNLAGVPSPLASADEHPVDLVIVRENTEGEYSDVGGGSTSAWRTIALQQTVFSRKGVSRIADYAFLLSGRRRGCVTSATKSNGIVHTMPFWDQVVRERAALHPEVALTEEHVDALAAKLVSRPE
jgi:tartrate dehydrogenase/decarboxylase / D-malate dehydrogenase